ncbi:hypothetical protein DAPPUDRAFT_330360 [Daphnia pulex]|uniref:Uncharacterized protein n=1 Tax=Daphnia pulex TaxID=6669 RepID=E9HJC2_DAPPU|nr:hypothetical protein DAPPUDRAFT_330360 [Daphnia pulex]|eukprot:EFX68146.1 hypothetical protein DAPPUDRAFT_330360 [Daphnia pulex]
MVSTSFSNDSSIRCGKTVNKEFKRNRDGLELSREFSERFKGVAGRRRLTEIRARYAFDPPQRPFVTGLSKPGMFLEFTAIGAFTLAELAQETNTADRFKISRSVEPGDGKDTICDSKIQLPAPPQPRPAPPASASKATPSTNSTGKKDSTVVNISNAAPISVRLYNTPQTIKTLADLDGFLWIGCVAWYNVVDPNYNIGYLPAAIIMAFFTGVDMFFAGVTGKMIAEQSFYNPL